MIEITNKKPFPVQLVVKSKTSTKSMTTLNVPGVGSGKNKVKLPEERMTEFIDRLVKWGMISKQTVA